MFDPEENSTSSAGQSPCRTGRRTVALLGFQAMQRPSVLWFVNDILFVNDLLDSNGNLLDWSVYHLFIQYPLQSVKPKNE